MTIPIQYTVGIPSIVLNGINVSNNFGGSLIAARNIMNLEIRNFRSTNNTDFGENPYEWKFEDWDH